MTVPQPQEVPTPVVPDAPVQPAVPEAPIQPAVPEEPGQPDPETPVPTEPDPE
jgi:hypothetical protein